MEISRVEQVLEAYRWVMSWAVWVWLLVSGVGLGVIEEDRLSVTLGVILLPLLVAGFIYKVLQRMALVRINERMAMAFEQLLDDMRHERWEGYRGEATCIEMFSFGRIANTPVTYVSAFMQGKGATTYSGQGEATSFNLENLL